VTPAVRGSALPRTGEEAVERVRRDLEAVAGAGRPVLVGPWVSEVGFELLYWLPFLRWAAAEIGLDPERTLAVSRGGVESWYAGIAGGYREIFNGCSPSEFRAAVEESRRQAGGQKHVHAGSLDRFALRAAGVDADTVAILHPGTMVALFRPFWLGNTPLEHVLDHVRPEPLRDAVPVDGLPAEYAVVRWYFRPSFPDTPSNRAFAARVTAELARHIDVVLLDTGLEFDDHPELRLEGERLHRPVLGVDAAANLRLQSAVVAGARLSLGTYGGLSYLAPLCGLPSVAFTSHPEHVSAPHLEVARAVSRITGGTLTMCTPDTFELVWQALEQ